MKTNSILSGVMLTLLCITAQAFQYPSFDHRFDSNDAANLYAVNLSKNLTLLKVTGYQQTEDYTCGPASIMSLLHYYHQLTNEQMNKATEMRIAKEMGTTADKGTSPQQMVKWLEHNGFDVKTGTNGTLNMLRDNLEHGIPTIVEWIDWGGHWAIVTGYYKNNTHQQTDEDTIYFADSSAASTNAHNPDGITSFNASRFDAMWFDAQYFKPGHLVKGIYIIATPKDNSKN